VFFFSFIPQPKYEQSIFYEDGQGHVVDEHACPEPMDYVVDEEQYTLQPISSHTDYLRTLYNVHNHREPAVMHVDEPQSRDIRMRESNTKRDYTVYTDQDKVRFFKLMFEKVLSASAAAKQLGIHVRSAQRWALQYEQDPDSLFKKRKSSGRPRILSDEHKRSILEWVDENPSIILEQLMEKLRQRFEGIQVSKTTLYWFVKNECNLSLKKAKFHPIDRNSEAKI
jgi:transposase